MLAVFHIITMLSTGNLLQEQFNCHWQQQFPQWTAGKTKLLLAVSGGIDSVVLTDLAYHAGIDFTIAHCNFHLRDEESNRDEQFVQQLGERYNKQVSVQNFDTLAFADEHKLSVQEAARQLRYNWFALLLQEDTALKAVATAHHADDTIETLLMHFFRGTGISGLHGIPSKQGNIIRPLLFASRDNIIAYAEANKLAWVEDSSNASDKYTRNFFRHQVIPLVQEAYPQVQENLLQNIRRFSEAELLYNEAVNARKKILLFNKGNEVQIPVLKLKQQTPLATVVWEIIKAYDFTAAQVNEVIKLLDAPNNGSYIASATHRIIRNRQWLIIVDHSHADAITIPVEKDDTHIAFDQKQLSIQQLTTLPDIPASSDVAALDASQLTYPLLLRKWKQGDYFYPLGMKKKKKLSRFFIDNKLSPTAKEKVWVLESNKRIAWVIGYRIDDRFKITPATKNISLLSTTITI